MLVGLIVNTHSRPSEDRTIPLSVIAERTKLSVENVEHLLMKSLSVSPIQSFGFKLYVWDLLYFMNPNHLYMFIRRVAFQILITAVVLLFQLMDAI